MGRVPLWQGASGESCSARATASSMLSPVEENVNRQVGKGMVWGEQMRVLLNE